MVTNDNGYNNDNGNVFQQEHSFLELQAMRMARWPKTHFWISFLTTLLLSFCGFYFGNFSVSVDNAGWQSRGTLIADRHTQLSLIRSNQEELFKSSLDNDDTVWKELMDNVQEGWESDDDATDEGRRQRDLQQQQQQHPGEDSLPLHKALAPHADWNGQPNHPRGRAGLLKTLPFMNRKLQGLTTSEVGSLLPGCDTSFYSEEVLTSDTRLWPIWKTNADDSTVLDSNVLKEICLAEQKTQNVLMEKGLCFGCGTTCLPPYSVVLYARFTVPNGMDMSCEELADAFSANYQTETEAAWKECVVDLEAGVMQPQSCPATFGEGDLVDEFFDTTGIIRYTSSIFATNWYDVDALYEAASEYDRGANTVRGAYDTQHEDFGGLLAETSLGRDMSLAVGSALITTLAILIHTKSPFLTLVGLLQILLSFPTAYFAYTFLGGLNFFPFLNFIGVFVVFALGADHIFVAVDKWKNARLAAPPGTTTEQVAAVALPDAAGAMMLTTSTTAVAFFGTAICPVAPVKCFAIFCGLLIAFDYFLDIILIFPCLCIYDRAGSDRNCFIGFTCTTRKEENTTNEMSIAAAADHSEPPQEVFPDGNELLQDKNQQHDQSDDEKPSFIRRLLSSYYTLLHNFRWLILAASTIALALCIWSAGNLELPASSDVRILSESIQFEQNYVWRQNLLSTALEKKGGSLAYFIWGTKPADTGDHNDPSTWSQLVLDETFDPSTVEGQVYMRDFCNMLYAQDFANLPEEGFVCPLERFDAWLAEQSSSENPEEIYIMHCAGATGLPLPMEHYNSCLVNWTHLVRETSILARNGIVQVMFLPFNSRIRYNSPNSVLQDEWNLINDWIETQQNDEGTPVEVSKFFFSSADFWWYDTNAEMFKTATGAAGIAIGAAAAVILFSSRSLVMTVFSIISVGYVLTSVTSCMVAVGWTLGFLESICFAILIGVSVDFVIHFSHAYVAMEGKVDRCKRTKYALLHMGPSILAAGFTSLAGAVIMLFTVITFFQKFALVLFLTIIQATIGSFVVFLVMADCFGPEEPTYVVDRLCQAVFCQESKAVEEKVQQEVEDSGTKSKKMLALDDDDSASLRSEDLMPATPKRERETDEVSEVSV